MNVRVMCLVVASIVLPGLCLPSTAAQADFGLIGITAFENARLTAYCDGSVAPNPCAVTLEFHDLGGRTLKQSTLTLPAGSCGFLDFTPPPAAFGGPIQIDPCFDILRGAAFTSLEVFDTFSQRTRILVNWGDRSLPKRGDVDFATAGITPNDKMRLGAFCEGDGSVMPPPCDVTFEFHDQQGNTIKQSRLMLQPGTGGFVDLTWLETRSPSRRVEITPCFKVATGAVVGSLEIVDNFFGLTLVQAYPAALAGNVP